MRDDEIGLLIDPKNPSQALSYITPDGTVIEPGQNDPRGVPSIIHPDLFVTHSQTKGFRSTMASRLGEMLIIAKSLFGKRDHSCTFLGFEFTEDAPHIHYEANRGMIMRLSASTMLEPMDIYPQMAHECVHMLSPCIGKPVTILEEGMAEAFAYLYMRDTMDVELPHREPGSAYHEASELVGMLLSINPYGIKAIREDEPTISLITKSLIWKHYPMIPEGVAARLARTFVRDGCTDPDILARYESEAPPPFV